MEMGGLSGVVFNGVEWAIRSHVLMKLGQLLGVVFSGGGCATRSHVLMEVWVGYQDSCSMEVGGLSGVV